MQQEFERLRGDLETAANLLYRIREELSNFEDAVATFENINKVLAGSGIKFLWGVNLDIDYAVFLSRLSAEQIAELQKAIADAKH